jgi:hypothetical protein
MSEILNNNSMSFFQNTQKSIDASLSDASNQLKEFGEQFKALLDNAMKQVTTDTDTVITTNFDNGTVKGVFKTTIGALTGNITNEFPPNRPSDNDVIWTIHKENVDAVLATRKELQLKIIETVGNTVKGLFNPVSVSNIDLVQIIQAVLSKK